MRMLASLERVRREFEAEEGKIPDDAWDYLVKHLGNLADYDDTEDFKQSARDWLGLARLCADSGPANREEIPRASAPLVRGPYNGPKHRRIGLVSIVFLARLLLGPFALGRGEMWELCAALYSHVRGKRVSPETLRRGYYRGLREHREYTKEFPDSFQAMVARVLARSARKSGESPLEHGRRIGHLVDAENAAINLDPLPLRLKALLARAIGNLN